jgi:hypothetical protein
LETIPAATDAFVVTNTMRHLGALLIASAFVEKDEADRMRLYLGNLDLLKKRIGRDDQALRAFNFGERVEEEVVRIADKAGIETRGRRTKELLEAGAAAGLAALTSLVLLPWSPVVALAGSPIAGFASTVVLGRARVGEHVGEGLLRERRLEDLYKAGSGLLRPRWEPPVAH